MKWRTVRSAVPGKLRRQTLALSKSAHPLLCPGFHLRGLYDLVQEEEKKNKHLQYPIKADYTGNDAPSPPRTCLYAGANYDLNVYFALLLRLYQAQPEQQQRAPVPLPAKIMFCVVGANQKSA